MSANVDSYVERANRHLENAADADSTAATIYYGHQAVCSLLGGILFVLRDIRDQQANRDA